MADFKTEYASSTASLDVTATATLANGVSGNSAALVNTTNRYLDYFVSISVTTNASAIATGLVEIWAKGSVDGTNYEDDGNDRWLGTITMGAAGVQTRRKVVSLAAGFNGPMPPYVILRIKNASGGSFTAATAVVLGVQGESV